MRSDYDMFPEVLLADGTYKVNVIHMPHYSSVVIDGNMDTKTACFFLLVKEDESSLRDMITVFKTHTQLIVGYMEGDPCAPPQNPTRPNFCVSLGSSKNDFRCC